MKTGAYGNLLGLQYASPFQRGGGGVMIVRLAYVYLHAQRSSRNGGRSGGRLRGAAYASSRCQPCYTKHAGIWNGRCKRVTVDLTWRCLMRRRQFLGAIPFLAAVHAASATVRRWVIITIGNLSRNRYWGESDEKPLRDAICTCTLISGAGFQLLVDPSLAAQADMVRELDRRTGLKPDQVTAVFVTHEHSDHFAGIEHFQEAVWYAAAPAAAILNRNSRFSRRFEPSPSNLFSSVDVIATPGHTVSHHSLRFDCEGQSVVITGDAVATRDYWRERRSYYNAVDPAQGAKTMDRLAGIASMLVPGHDNYFQV